MRTLNLPFPRADGGENKVTVVFQHYTILSFVNEYKFMKFKAYILFQLKKEGWLANLEGWVTKLEGWVAKLEGWVAKLERFVAKLKGSVASEGWVVKG